MGFWLVDKAGGSGVLNPRIGVGENNQFRIEFIDIDQKDIPFYYSGKVARLRALQPQQHYSPGVYRTNAICWLLFSLKGSALPADPPKCV